MSKRTTAALAATALVAAPTALLVGLTTAPAHADIDRQGSCGSGRYEFSVDREGRGFETQVDLDFLKPGSRWTIVIKQDGKRVVKTTRTADREGELDVERYLPNTSGKDVVSFKASRVGGKASCGRTITVR